MMNEAFVRAVEAERAREREHAMLAHRLQGLQDREPRPARTRGRGFSRLAELVRFLFLHRRQPRRLAAADVADQTFAG